MKNLVLLYIAFLIVIQALPAQTWKKPVNIIDPETISGGDFGAFSQLMVVNGNPAMVAADIARGGLLFIRALDPAGTNWAKPVKIDSRTSFDCSMQIVNGHPAISYFDLNKGDLIYVRSLDASGTVWPTPLTLDGNTSYSGSYTSLEVVNGHPAISYYDQTNGDLKYIRSMDASGIAWAQSITVDTAKNVGAWTSLRVVNGNPAISYYDNTNRDLKYVYSKDISGSDWELPITIDANRDAGTRTFLQVVNGHPAIAYNGQGVSLNSALMYIRASDSTGKTWNNPVIIDSSSNGLTSFTSSSLQIVNGKPAISYQSFRSNQDLSGFNLNYVVASDASGASWQNPITIDNEGIVGQYSSLQVVNGNPAISYYDQTKGELKYIRAVNPSGTIWMGPLSFSLPADFRSRPDQSLRSINGHPAISYYENGNLRYIRATDTSGAIWGTPVSVDLAGDVGVANSMQVVNGNPAIAYSDNTNAYLKYVRASNANGAAWGVPIVIDSAAGFNNNTSNISLQVVNGYPALSYYANRKLMYMRAKDISGEVWTKPIILDSIAGGFVGYYNSMEVVDGNPAIAYFDITNRDLKYICSKDSSGVIWETPIRLDSTGQVGHQPSLQVVNGNPAIAYWDASNSDLKYIRAIDKTGKAWSSPIKVDFAGQVGASCSMQVVNGVPAISYQDIANTDLKYVKAIDSSGTVWAPPVFVDINGNVGEFMTSLQVINGNPAISYWERAIPGSFINSTIKFVSANDTSVKAWIAPIKADVTPDVGRFSSMQVVNGNPGISYYDITNKDLKFIRAKDASGSAWTTPVTVDAAGDVGFFTSLKIVNSNPAIAYIDNTTQHLKFVRATDASGSAWGTPIIADNATGNVRFYTSIQIVDGNPAIAYYDNTRGDLKYVRATNASGTDWGTPIFVDTIGDMGQFASLQVVNGFPAIAYRDFSAGDLKYIRAIDAVGTAWGIPVRLDAIGDVGVYNSLEIVGGKPAIAYQDFGNKDLKYIRAKDISGLSWTTPVKLDFNEQVGAYPSLRIVNGKAAISYYDETNHDLKFIQAADDSATVWGAPVTLDFPGDVGYYPSLQQVNGNAAISYYDLTNGDLKYILANSTSVSARFASNSVCPGSGFSLNYLSTGLDFNSGNVFAVHLSDSSGNFTNSMVIGMATDTSVNGAITISIPANVLPGKNYRIRLVSSNPVITGSPSDVLIVNPIPPTPVITQNENILTSNAASGNQWYVNTVLIPGATAQNYTAKTSGSFTTQVVLNNCASSFSNSINLTVTAVENSQEFGHQIKVFPNPVSDKLIITTTNVSTILNARLVDIYGKIIRSWNAKILRTEIDMSEFASGTYILWLEDMQHTISGKMKIIKL